MYSLISGLYRYMTRKDEYAVLILGLDNAGKTTFLEQTKIIFDPTAKGVNLSKITATVGLNIGSIDVGGIRLCCWDLGGQEELQCLWDKYYAESHAVVYLFDSSDRLRLEESKSALRKMLSNSTLSSVPVLILGNKQDVPNAASIDELRELLMLDETIAAQISERVSTWRAVSALEGDGIDEAIRWIVEAVKRNELNRPPKCDE